MPILVYYIDCMEFQIKKTCLGLAIDKIIQDLDLERDRKKI
jgi:hypothetical protein